MAVGGLEETVTVTGEAPVVDVQTVTRTAVLDQELMDALPTAQRYSELVALLPGATPNRSNTGGSSGDNMASLSIHGGPNNGQKILSNGLNTSGIAGAGHISGVVPNTNSASEIIVDVSGAGAELSQGGVRINYIPRDGGNTFAGSFNANFSNSGMQGDNYSKRLKGLGLRTPNTVEQIYEISGGFGGPILRDELWFWVSGQDFGSQTAAAGSFYNANAYNPNVWTYKADTSRRGINKGHWYSVAGRFTWQASARNKLAISYDSHDHCRCPDGISSTRAPDAAADRRFPHQMLYTAEWTAPLTNRLLVELTGLHRTTRWGNMQTRFSEPEAFASGAMAQMVAVQEQTTGLRYRNRNFFNSNFNHNYFVRGTISYITGTHNLKAGFTDLTGWLVNEVHSFRPYEYRLRNGVPNRITFRAAPWFTDIELPMDLGLFIQDRYTVDRMTLNLGLRYDYMEVGWPSMQIGPVELVPNRSISLPAVSGNISWHDITYRLGFAYDVFGDGRTAIKASANKFLQAQTATGLGTAAHPANTLINTAVRSWNDADQDFVPDCDLTSKAKNGECGPMSNQRFGSTKPAQLFDSELMNGFGVRGYNWEMSAGIQHEVTTGVSVDVAYFRRIYGNFRVNDNTLVGPSDFDTFSVVAPSDSRLPGGGGQTISNLYNVKPGKFGQNVSNTTLARKFGKQTQHWNGVDVTVNARMQNGLRVQGGVSTGTESRDSCDLRKAMPEIALTNPYCKTSQPLLTQYKALVVYTIPTIDVILSGTLRSYPGPQILANYRANNAAISPSLGRNLSGGANNVSVSLVEPMSQYGERLNQIDMRVGKVFRVAGARTSVNLDIYNLLNVDAVTGLNNNFGPVWQRPSATVLARFIKVSATFDF
jgi:hypothetical protein